MAQPHVHTFYRIWFTWVEPLVLLATVLTCIFTPESFFETVVPASISPFQPNQAVLIHQTAALYAFMAVIYAVLLRASPDLRVWRIVQAATLAVDIALIGVLYVALKQQGRLDVEKLRAIDLFGFLFTVWVALIRIAYLRGIGGTKSGNIRKGA